MADILRMPSAKIPHNIRKFLGFVHEDPENVVLISVHMRDVAYLISPSEFVKYQQWKAFNGGHHPALRPYSLKVRDRILLKKEPFLRGPVAKQFNDGKHILKPFRKIHRHSNLNEHS